MTPRARRLALLAALAGVVALVAWGLTTTVRVVQIPSDVAASSDRPASLAAAEKPNTAGKSPAVSAPAGDDLIPLGEAPAGTRIRITAHVVANRIPSLVTGQERGRVPSVTVRLRLDAPEPVPFAAQSAVSDADGKVTFAPVPIPRIPRRFGDRAALVVETDGSARDDGIRILARESIDAAVIEGRGRFGNPPDEDGIRRIHVFLQRDPGPFLLGSVTNAAGDPIQGAHVGAPKDIWAHTWTDDQGRFSMPLEAVGRTTIEVCLMQWSDREPQVKVDLDVPAAGLLDLHWVIPDVGVVSGRVLEVDGRAAAGAEVFLTPAGKTAAEADFEGITSSFGSEADAMMRRVTASDGTFRFVGPVEGKTYDLRWRDASGAEHVAVAGVATGTKDVEFRMERHGVLARLVDEGGRPVYGDVTYRSFDDGEAEDDAFFGRREHNEGLLAPAGTRVALHARAAGYTDRFLQHTVSDRPGLEAVPVLMKMSPAPRALVTVRCVDAERSLLPWPTVRWTHVATGIGVRPVAVEAPDSRAPAGFATRTLDAGTYRVRTWVEYCDSAECAGSPASGALEFVLPAETTIEVPPTGAIEVAWMVPRGGSLRLTFRRGDGQEVEPGDLRSVWAHETGGKATAVSLFRRNEERWVLGTGAVTAYRSQALPAGDYDVAWYRHGDSDSPPPATARIAVARAHVVAGETTDVVLQGLSGPR